jgi:hypothetical protein
VGRRLEFTVGVLVAELVEPLGAGGELFGESQIVPTPLSVPLVEAVAGAVDKLAGDLGRQLLCLAVFLEFLARQHLAGPVETPLVEGGAGFAKMESPRRKHAHVLNCREWAPAMRRGGEP